MKMLKLNPMMYAIGVLNNKFNKDLDMKDGEFIISIPVKIQVGEDDKILSIEHGDFIREYNECLKEEKMQEEMRRKVNQKIDNFMNEYRK